MSGLRKQLEKIAEEYNVRPLVENLSPNQKSDETTLNNSLYKVMCSFDIFYRQVKFYHWIIRGQNYIATHRFLDELADMIREKIDLLAERLVYLKFIPEYEFHVVESKSDVKYVVSPNANMNEIIENLLKQFDIIISNLKDSADKSQSDYGTQQFITEVIYDIEVFKHHIESFKE